MTSWVRGDNSRVTLQGLGTLFDESWAALLINQLAITLHHHIGK